MSETEPHRRLVITPRAAELLKQLQEEHGPLLFRQSGGCCDGSVPICMKQSEFRIGGRDVLLDTVEETPFYVDELLFQYIRNEQTVLDAVSSLSDSFSLEAARDMRFITRTVGPVCAAPSTAGARSNVRARVAGLKASSTR